MYEVRYTIVYSTYTYPVHFITVAVLLMTLKILVQMHKFFPDIVALLSLYNFAHILILQNLQ